VAGPTAYELGLIERLRSDNPFVYEAAAAELFPSAYKHHPNQLSDLFRYIAREKYVRKTGNGTDLAADSEEDSLWGIAMMIYKLYQFLGKSKYRTWGRTLLRSASLDRWRDPLQFRPEWMRTQERIYPIKDDAYMTRKASFVSFDQTTGDGDALGSGKDCLGDFLYIPREPFPTGGVPFRDEILVNYLVNLSYTYQTVLYHRKFRGRYVYIKKTMQLKFKGRTLEETSRRMGISPQAVSKLCRRAEHQLGLKLKCNPQYRPLLTLVDIPGAPDHVPLLQHLRPPPHRRFNSEEIQESFHEEIWLKKQGGVKSSIRAGRGGPTPGDCPLDWLLDVACWAVRTAGFRPDGVPPDERERYENETVHPFGRVGYEPYFVRYDAEGRTLSQFVTEFRQMILRISVKHIPTIFESRDPAGTCTKPKIKCRIFDEVYSRLLEEYREQQRKTLPIWYDERDAPMAPLIRNTTGPIGQPLRLASLREIPDKRKHVLDKELMLRHGDWYKQPHRREPTRFEVERSKWIERVNCDEEKAARAFFGRRLAGLLANACKVEKERLSTREGKSLAENQKPDQKRESFASNQPAGVVRTGTG
jgi:DNA-directed RNA polymerase specialized sigma24 family protein